VLEDFGRFWEDARGPEARRELLQQLFELVWIDGHKIVAVRPTTAFASFFLPGTNNAAPGEAAMCKERERRGSNPDCAPQRDRGPDRMKSANDPPAPRATAPAWVSGNTAAQHVSGSALAEPALSRFRG
jgi:hypothetical protein